MRCEIPYDFASAKQGVGGSHAAQPLGSTYRMGTLAISSSCPLPMQQHCREKSAAWSTRSTSDGSSAWMSVNKRFMLILAEVPLVIV